MLHQDPDRRKHQPSQFQAGRAAFKRGELPHASWPKAKHEGWNFEGENQFWSATADELQAKEHDRSTVEYLPLSDAPGYTEGRQPFLY